MVAPLEFDDEPAPMRRQSKEAIPWGKLWLTIFTSTIAAILVVQVLNALIAWAAFNWFMNKMNETNQKRAAEVQRK